MRNLLGGKGANLAEMTSVGIPVPPGFTLSADVCEYYYDHERQYPDSLNQEVREHLTNLEELMGKKLGDENDPLLVSVRSGAPVSMPGMMDTVLNLGLNDKAVIGFGHGVKQSALCVGFLSPFHQHVWRCSYGYGT